MDYRIKITTFKDGRKEYTPEVKIKNFLGFSKWKSIYSDGTIAFFSNECISSKNALDCIIAHNAGGGCVESIEFELIEPTK